MQRRLSYNMDERVKSVCMRSSMCTKTSSCTRVRAIYTYIEREKREKKEYTGQDLSHVICIEDAHTDMYMYLHVCPHMCMHARIHHTQGLSADAGKELLEDMLLGRQFEDMCAQMYYRGKMFGFVHLYSGQEAVSTGVIKAGRSDDYVCSTYRDHVHALSKGVPSRQVMAELFGKSTGCCRGQGGSMHIFSAPHNMLGGFAFIGEGIPIATGAAFQIKYRRERGGKWMKRLRLRQS